MAILSGGDIVKAARDLHQKTSQDIVDCPMPELGTDAVVRIGVMSGAERDYWDVRYAHFLRDARERGQNGMPDKRPVQCIRADLMFLTARDADGKPAFQHTNQLKVLAETTGPVWNEVLERYWAEAVRVNGLGGSAVEDAAKNSESEPNSTSGSGSPATSASPSESFSHQTVPVT